MFGLIVAQLGEFEIMNIQTSSQRESKTFQRLRIQILGSAVAIIISACLLCSGVAHHVESPHRISSRFLDELARGDVANASALCDPTELRVVEEEDGGVRFHIRDVG